MRKLLAILTVFMLISATTMAQRITGNVKDEQGKGVDKSTISLLNAKDSSVIKLAVTSDNGKFTIAAEKPGQYLVSSSHVGYTTVYSKVFEVSGSGDINLGDISMALSLIHI